MSSRLAVGAVVLRGDEVLLVRRRNPPRAGAWSLPGGRPEPGETWEAAVGREIREETGLQVRVERFLEAVELGPWVVLDYLASAPSGEPVAADDALEARFVPVEDLEAFDVGDAVRRVVRTASATATPA